VQAAYSEYQQRALGRDSLRRMYIGTLTLALILAVFAAVLLAIVLGNQLAKPLLLLADGVRQVARGDLTAKPVFASGDELGGLTRSFADMTAQVAEARSQVQRGMGQLEAARTRLQTILDTLTAGVIVFDREGRIDTVNPGATRILQRPLSAWRGRRLSELPDLQDFARSVEQRFELLATSPEAGERDQWQDSFELKRGDGATLTLLVRGATLQGERAAPQRRAADGVRRHHRSGLGAAQRRLGRSGAPAGARDQEPAHAHPALGRTAAAPPGPQARGRRPGAADAFGAHHRPRCRRCRPWSTNSATTRGCRRARCSRWTWTRWRPKCWRCTARRWTTGCWCPGWKPACRASWATPRNCGRSSTTWCRTAWTRWPTGPTARSS
jgi:PAS domain-containing protein